jgi:peptidoglycan/xylan/chitin deacetylase (PgdA/CDA1 family)
MATYWVKTPQWIKKIFPAGMVWDMPVEDTPAVYLTFDDGPNPVATPYVLDALAKYDAKATFFCVGNNVAKYPEIYNRVLDEGHGTGNHTYNHLNGWKTRTAHYLKNIEQASKHIKSKLFRPPYGRMRHSQARQLHKQHPGWKICMWDVLSADFDTMISPEQCLDNVLVNIEPGSIILFHDSEKAFERMSYALPKVLAYCAAQKWEMRVL